MGICKKIIVAQYTTLQWPSRGFEEYSNFSLIGCL